MKPNSEQVPIVLTEIITSSDRPDDIEKKRLRLAESMNRHGVADPEIKEGWIEPHGRALIGSGMGKPFELTADQQERRRQEQAALGGAVLSRLVNMSLPALPADDSGPAASRANAAEAELAEAKKRIAELEKDDTAKTAPAKEAARR